MLWWVCFFNYADRQTISVVTPVLKQKFGFDTFQLGLIGSAFMWVYAAGAPFAGWVADRFSKRHLILGGCLFWSGVTVATGACTQLWQFIGVRALEGLGETFYFPASMALISAYHGSGSRSKAMAFHQSGVYAGTIGGSWIGALLAEHFGWTSGFYLFGGAGMLLAVLLYFFLQEPAKVATVQNPVLGPSVLHTFLALWRQPAARSLLLGFALANFVAAIFLFWTPAFLVQKFNFKLSSSGLSGSVFIHAASAISAPFAGWWADRWMSRRLGGRMWVQGTGLILGAGFVALLGATPSVSILIATMIGFGLCKGLYDSGIFASLYDVVPSGERAAAAGIMNTVGWVGGALGPTYAGWMGRYAGQGSEVGNLSLAVSLCGIVYLGAALLLFNAARQVEAAPRTVSQ